MLEKVKFFFFFEKRLILAILLLILVLLCFYLKATKAKLNFIIINKTYLLL